MASTKPFRIVQEIISNSFDEDSVKDIKCELKQKGSKQVEVTITDDGEGFIDIKDVYTMYKYSYKRSNTEKRGRFNLGEKQFFVLAEYGFVKTKNQMVEFKEDTRTTSKIDHPRGTVVYGVFNWNGNDLKEILLKLHQLIVPKEKTLLINDTPIRSKEHVKTITGALPTLIEDKDSKILRRVTKTTRIDIYKVKEGEKPFLYELGIPVHKLLHSIEWHVDVRQKIPLPTGRDMVSEAYLNELYASILNNATELIDEENAGSKWVQVAMSKSTPESAKTVLEKHLGTSQVYIPSSSDYHANEAVLEEGGKLLKQGFFDRETRDHLKEMDILKLSTDDFASQLATSKPVTELTMGMELYRIIIKAIARDCIKKEIEVIFVESDSSHPAWYGSDVMTWNVSRVAKKEFDDFSEWSVGTIIHELSHDKEHHEGENVPHYTKEFVSELERIGGIVGKKGISYYFNQAKTWEPEQVIKSKVSTK
jgi:hypothetical protein